MKLCLLTWSLKILRLKGNIHILFSLFTLRGIAFIARTISWFLMLVNVIWFKAKRVKHNVNISSVILYTAGFTNVTLDYTVLFPFSNKQFFKSRRINITFIYFLIVWKKFAVKKWIWWRHSNHVVCTKNLIFVLLLNESPWKQWLHAINMANIKMIIR